MDSLRQEKVQRFEEFVDKRLKPDLVHAIAQRYSVCFSAFYSSLFETMCIKCIMHVILNMAH